MSSGNEKQDFFKYSFMKLTPLSAFVLVVVLMMSLQSCSKNNDNLKVELESEQKIEKLLKLRAHEEKYLTSYGIVDEQSGIYRIPIDQAMKLLVD